MVKKIVKAPVPPAGKQIPAPALGAGPPVAPVPAALPAPQGPAAVVPPAANPVAPGAPPAAQPAAPVLPAEVANMPFPALLAHLIARYPDIPAATGRVRQDFNHWMAVYRLAPRLIFPENVATVKEAAKENFGVGDMPHDAITPVIDDAAQARLNRTASVAPGSCTVAELGQLWVATTLPNMKWSTYSSTHDLKASSEGMFLLAAACLYYIPSADRGFFTFLREADQHSMVTVVPNIKNRLRLIKNDPGEMGLAWRRLQGTLSLLDLQLLKGMDLIARQLLAYLVGIWLALKSPENPFTVKEYTCYLVPTTDSRGLHLNVKQVQLTADRQGRTPFGNFLEDRLMGSCNVRPGDQPPALKDGDAFRTVDAWNDAMDAHHQAQISAIASSAGGSLSLLDGQHRSVTDVGANSSAPTNVTGTTKRLAPSQATRFTERMYHALTPTQQFELTRGICLLCGHSFNNRHRAPLNDMECPVYARNPAFRSDDRHFFAAMVGQGVLDPSGRALLK